jgi:hypothetical protein
MNDWQPTTGNCQSRIVHCQLRLDLGGWSGAGHAVSMSANARRLSAANTIAAKYLPWRGNFDTRSLRTNWHAKRERTEFSGIALTFSFGTIPVA